MAVPSIIQPRSGGTRMLPSVKHKVTFRLYLNARARLTMTIRAPSQNLAVTELVAPKRPATVTTDRKHAVPTVKALTMYAGRIVMRMPSVENTPKLQGRSAHSMFAARHLGMYLMKGFPRR